MKTGRNRPVGKAGAVKSARRPNPTDDLRAGSRSRRPEPACNRTRQQMEPTGDRIPQTTCGRAAATGTGGCSPGRRADNGSGRPEPAGRQIPQQMKPTGRKSRQLQLELTGTVAAGGRIAKQSRRFFLLSCRMIVVPVFFYGILLFFPMIIVQFFLTNFFYKIYDSILLLQFIGEINIFYDYE